MNNDYCLLMLENYSLFTSPDLLTLFSKHVIVNCGNETYKSKLVSTLSFTNIKTQ